MSGERKIESFPMSKSTTAPTYESLYARMQAIVARLEAGELPLGEALALYEEGVEVAAACQRLLDQAELRIQELQPGGGTKPGLWEE
jgi:exodeoxyribonuclease VII small subunit